MLTHVALAGAGLVLLSAHAPVDGGAALGAVSAPFNLASRPAAKPDFRGAVEIFNCSGALVRWSNSRPDDPAMMLTNGHCRQVLDKGVAPTFTRDVIVDQPDSRPVTLIGRNGNDKGVVRTKRLLYSTSFKTDVGLYLLRRTYAQIRDTFHLRALTLATDPPANDAHVLVPSGFSRKIYSCDLNGTAFRLFNDDFRWRQSIRLVPTSTCRTIHGTSGSPLLDPQTREVVGVNNAINLDAGVPGCHVSLCERTKDGDLSIHKHRRYAQQTWWLTTCVGSDRRIDLTVDGCKLPKPPT